MVDVDFLILTVVIAAFGFVAQRFYYPRIRRRELDAFLDEVIRGESPPES